MTEIKTPDIRKGGSWILEETPEDSVFVPEQMTEEHQLIDQTAQQFVTNEVTPCHDQLEAKNWDLAGSLL